MLLHLLFAAVVLGDGVCESGTCRVCKTLPGCDWYRFDCLAKNSTAVVKLSINATTCDACQAGSCEDCKQEDGCKWYNNKVPGLGGSCFLNTSTPSATVYADVNNTCPACYTSTNCTACTSREAEGCGWYVLPGGLNGKCREASPAFTYNKVPADSCDTGNRCAGIASCANCKLTNVTASANSATCAWYTSTYSTFYNSKCDDSRAGLIDSQFYKKEDGVCPVCAGTSCVDCKAEANCKWVAVSQGLGSAFGECMSTSTTTPSVKSVIASCPAECDVHSCSSCISKPNNVCNWFTGSPTADDSCDLASDAKLQHPFQEPIPTTARPSCGKCMADRCYECNIEAGCGWYVEKFGIIYGRAGCYANDKIPSNRVLRNNTDPKCAGVPKNGAIHVTSSMGVLLLLALFV